MMIKPISHYVALRNGSKLAPEVARTPYGQRSRAAQVDAHHMVYVARQAGSTRVKIGRTKDPVGRMRNYEQNSGVAVNFVVRIMVASAECAQGLERAVVCAMRARFPAFRREWFECSPAEAYGIIVQVVQVTTVNVISMTGNPTVEDDEPSFCDTEVSELKAMVAVRHRRSKF